VRKTPVWLGHNISLFALLTSGHPQITPLAQRKVL
jgi:hypothetical protein